MNIKNIILLLVALLLSPAAFAQFTESELQNIYQDMLSDEGIESSIDSDGDIKFEYEDLTLYIFVNESDQEFFRIVLMNIWSIESISERSRVLEAMDETNRDMKVAKIYSLNDNVWIASELFVDHPRDAAPIFERSLDVIKQAYNEFNAIMKN